MPPENLPQSSGTHYGGQSSQDPVHPPFVFYPVPLFSSFFSPKTVHLRTVKFPGLWGGGGANSDVDRHVLVRHMNEIDETL